MVKFFRFLPKIEVAIHRCPIKNSFNSFKKFIGEHICRSLFLNKVAGLLPTTFLKKVLLYRCFPANFVKCFTAIFRRAPPGDCFYFGTAFILLFAELTSALKCYYRPVFFFLKQFQS